MAHYICKGGCKGVSDKPGVCQADDCANHKHQLEECNCTDGKHFGAFDDTSVSGAEKGNEDGSSVVKKILGFLGL